MRKKMAVSVGMSALTGVAGIVFLVTFFSSHRSPFELVVGMLLVFLAVLNGIMMYRNRTHR